MTNEGLSLNTPATYRIHGKGYLDNSWSDWPADLTIMPTVQVEKLAVTTRLGQLIDQTVLFGVFNV